MESTTSFPGYWTLECLDCSQEILRQTCLKWASLNPIAAQLLANLHAIPLLLMSKYWQFVLKHNVTSMRHSAISHLLILTLPCHLLLLPPPPFHRTLCLPPHHSTSSMAVPQRAPAASVAAGLGKILESALRQRGHPPIEMCGKDAILGMFTSQANSFINRQPSSTLH